MTPSGIELATLRLVAQHLDHCATAALRYHSDTDEYFHKIACSFVGYCINLHVSPTT